jgi:hypothetical protein
MPPLRPGADGILSVPAHRSLTKTARDEAIEQQIMALYSDHAIEERSR